MAHNGGRLQVNLGDPSPQKDRVFLNALKMAGGPLTAYDSGSSITDNLKTAKLNANGYPTAMPTGAGSFWQQNQLYLWGNVGDVWDLVYPSQHTLSIASAVIGFSLIDSTAGHKKYQITSVPSSTVSNVHACVVKITAMSGTDWTGGISVYRAEHQALVTAGEIFDPRFLEHLGYPGKPFGIVRTGLGWGNVNNNISNSQAFEHVEADLSWVSAIQDVRYFAGQATIAANVYTTPTAPGSPASWVDGQIIQFYNPTNPTYKSITAVTVGNPTSFACTAHGYSNGDTIEFAKSFAQTANFNAAFVNKLAATGLAPFYTVTVVDANNFTINLNSTGYVAATVPFSVHKMIKITDGTLPAKRCVNPQLAQYYEDYWTVYTSSAVLTAHYLAEFDACILLLTFGSDSNSFGTVPATVQCKLGNKIKSHIWFNIPFLYDGAQERALITAVLNTLDSDLTAFFEKGNENWNSKFDSTSQAGSHALKQLGSSTAMHGDADKINNLSANLITVYGAASTAYKLVCGVQMNSGVSTTVTNLFESVHVTPTLLANKLDMVVSAHYVSPGMGYFAANAASYPGFVTQIQNWKTGTPSLMNAAYLWYANEHRTSSSVPVGDCYPLDVQLAQTALWIASLTTYTGRLGTGVKFSGYEGGAGTAASTTAGGFPSGGVTTQDLQNFTEACLLSAEWAAFQTDMLNQFKAAGFVNPSYLSITNRWDYSNTAGLWRSNAWDEAVSLPWTAAYNWNYQPLGMLSLQLRF